MAKKIALIVGMILVVAAVGLGLLLFRLAGMANSIASELAKVTAVDLNKVADGTYSGSYGDFVVSARVEVVVKKHRLVKVTVKEQNCGKGYEAPGTVERIIKAQSPKVDAVTGASSSSRTIMIAVARALQKGAIP